MAGENCAACRNIIYGFKTTAYIPHTCNKPPKEIEQMKKDMKTGSGKNNPFGKSRMFIDKN